MIGTVVDNHPVQDHPLRIIQSLFSEPSHFGAFLAKAEWRRGEKKKVFTRWELPMHYRGCADEQLKCL